MTMKKYCAILAAAALLAVALAGCASPQKQLAGKWQGSAIGLDFNAFEFTPDAKDSSHGTVSLGMLSSLVSGTYAVTPGKKGENDKLSITYSVFSLSHTVDYTFTVTDTTLTLYSANSSIATVYTRQAS